jgi:hypothetical protein
MITSEEQRRSAPAERLASHPAQRPQNGNLFRAKSYVWTSYGDTDALKNR